LRHPALESLGNLNPLKGPSPLNPQPSTLNPQPSTLPQPLPQTLYAGQLPESLGNLKNLKDLSLTRNRIGWLPGTLRNLVNVEEMRLSFNRLHSLPAEMGYMTSLVCLCLCLCGV
jgi:Leucine-rich repeat (LRR) protein